MTGTIFKLIPDGATDRSNDDDDDDDDAK